MGYYLDVPNALNKASQLIKLHNAVDIGLAPDKLSDISKDKVLVCVIENGTFDAAAICFSQEELEAFHYDGTDRRRTWLTLDLEEVVKMKTHLEEYLRGEKPWGKHFRQIVK